MDVREAAASAPPGFASEEEKGARKAMGSF